MCLIFLASYIQGPLTLSFFGGVVFRFGFFCVCVCDVYLCDAKDRAQDLVYAGQASVILIAKTKPVV